MRKKTKRLLSGLLSLAMALSLVTVSPGVESNTVQAASTNLLTGGEFDSGDSDSLSANWNPTVSSTENYSNIKQEDESLNVYNGLNSTNAMSISQKVSVGAGVYQVSVDVKGATSESGLVLSVKKDEKELVDSVKILAASEKDYNTLSTSVFEVKETTEITVSISGDVTASYWAYLDNITLSQFTLEKLELLTDGEFSDSDNFKSNWSPSVNSWNNGDDNTSSTFWIKDNTYLNVWNALSDMTDAMSISQTVSVLAGIYQVKVDVKGATSASGLSLSVQAGDDDLVDKVTILAASGSGYNTLSTSVFEVKETTEITVSISGDVTASYWANLDNLLIYGVVLDDSETLTLDDLTALITKAKKCQKDTSLNSTSVSALTTPLEAAEKCTSLSSTTDITTCYNNLKDAIDGLYYDSEDIMVEKVSGISDDFIKGVDISSYVAETASGVKFYNGDNTEVTGAAFIKTLADAGVNYIRLRVWNQPYVVNTTDNGEGGTVETAGAYYGGGNNDINTAVTICNYIAAYNSANSSSTQIKVLIDLHYSDFWADPDKQTAPKAWKDMDIDEKVTKVKEFTKDCIAKVEATGVTVGMVQIGNETNNGICGTKIPTVANDDSGNPDYTSAKDSDYIKVFKAGCEAVDAYNTTKGYSSEAGTNIQKVVHFTDPHTAGTFYAKLLKECGVDYDIYATSYYPYWHGTTENLQKMLSTIADECSVKVMVAETQYIYTNDDYDGADNQAYEEKDNITLSGWPVSVQGQANEIRDVINAVASVGDAGIGMFYWEPAWLGVGNAYNEGELDDDSLAANKKIWEEKGSGWATDAAAEYDSSAKQYGGGGTNIENAALFDQDGKPLESLYVFKYVDHGAKCATASYYTYEALKSVEVIMGSDAETIKEKLPGTATYSLNDGTTNSAGITWNETSIADVVEKISTTGSIGKSYSISGTITVNEEQQKVKCSVVVEPVNLLENSGFENGSDDESWTVENAWADNSESNSHNGKWYLKFKNDDDDLLSLTASQTVEITEPGVYEAKTFVHGLYETGSRDGETIYLSASVGDLNYQSDTVVLQGWQVWQTPTVSDIVITQKMIDKGLNKITVTANATIASGVWGSFDDFYLYKAGDVPDDYVELESLSVDKQNVSIDKGETAKLNVSYNPSDTDQTDVTWTSSNDDIATVKDGTVTAVAYGDAVITVSSKYDPDITASCKITVVKTTEAASTEAATTEAATTPTTTAESAAVGTVVQPVGGEKGTFTVTNAGETPEVSYTIKKSAKTAVIPDTIKDSNGVEYKVTSIVKDTFKGNTKLKSVSIGLNVTAIEANAFNGCKKLSTVTIGKSVVSIGKAAFKGCTALTAVKIPASVKTIGAEAFSGDTKLKTVTMGSGVTTIGEKAFYNCSKLAKLTITKNVNKIGKKAFYNCKALKTITIKTTKLTKKTVGAGAFKGINAKATIKVPKSKLKAYKTLLKSKGVGSEAKIKKN